MKRSIFLFLSTLAVGTLFSCVRADQDFVHDDCTISAIYITPFNVQGVASVAGQINQETGEILFPVNKKLRAYYDLTKLNVFANIGYDARISPSLSGLKDLSEPFPITVTASMTGRQKQYTLEAYYSLNDGTGNENASSTRIAAFKVVSNGNSYEAVVDGQAGTITLECYEEDAPNMVRATAEAEIPAGASIYPPLSRPADYTQPITFRVTSPDGKSTQDYLYTPGFLHVPVAQKPVVLWIDAAANFSRLKTRAGIDQYLDIAQAAGFNGIVLDVKPVQGEAMFASDILPLCTSLNGTDIPDRGFDYVQYFIDEARKRAMRISLSLTALTMGEPATKTGPGYTDPRWDGMFSQEYLPDGIRDIRETEAEGIFAFLNPCLPAVHDYVVDFCKEIVSKYDMDGLVLDYCRYQNIHSDFSPASKLAFEQYMAEKTGEAFSVENFPGDIYTYSGSDPWEYDAGKYYKQWLQWRASVIQGYVTDIRAAVKAIKPDVDLEYWGASWIASLNGQAQNWASPANNWSGSYWWSAPDYYKTGFGDQLDILQLGAYLSVVFGPDNRSSIEYALNYSKTIFPSGKKMFGSFGIQGGDFDEDATCLCYEKGDGVMVFELSHLINNNSWNRVRNGLREAMKRLGEY